MKNKDTRRIIILSCLFIALVVGITLLCLPYINKLSEPEFQDEFKKWVSTKGIAGPMIVMGIQILQIVVAFIPGEPVEIIAGVLYGMVGGTLCLLGCVLASSAIFALSKRFGKRFLYRIFSKEKVKSWRWLHDNKKIATATFILFFIPGTPKDMLTYVVGVSEMKLNKFLTISTIARIPSIFSSAAVGSTMIQGEWEISIIVFVFTGIIGIIGILYNERIIDFCRRITMRDRGNK